MSNISNTLITSTALFLIVSSPVLANGDQYSSSVSSPTDVAVIQQISPSQADGDNTIFFSANGTNDTANLSQNGVVNGINVEDGAKSRATYGNSNSTTIQQSGQFNHTNANAESTDAAHPATGNSEMAKVGGNNNTVTLTTNGNNNSLSDTLNGNNDQVSISVTGSAAGSAYNNAVSVNQHSGNGNVATVTIGDGYLNKFTVDQTGDSNGAGGLIANGSRNTVSETQLGSSNGASVELSGGSLNNDAISQSGTLNAATILQGAVGNHPANATSNANSATIKQGGNDNIATIEQTGSYDVANITQSNSYNTASIYQMGVRNNLSVTQSGNAKQSQIVQK